MFPPDGPPHGSAEAGRIIIVSEPSGAGAAIESAVAAGESVEHVELCQPGNDVRSQFNKDEIDCVVTDMDPADERVVDWCAAIRDTVPNLPIVLVSGPDTLGQIGAAFEAGVTDLVDWTPGEDAESVLKERTRRPSTASGPLTTSRRRPGPRRATVERICGRSPSARPTRS